MLLSPTVHICISLIDLPFDFDQYLLLLLPHPKFICCFIDFIRGVIVLPHQKITYFLINFIRDVMNM